MNSARLIQLIQRFRSFREEQATFEKGEVYPLATLAQKELCSELYLLQFTFGLKLITGQETYQFNELAITAAAGSDPVTLTSVAHGLNTGDTVFISGVLGKTGVNGRRVITKVDADTFTVPVVDAGVYTSGGIIHHALNGALKINKIYKVTPVTGEIVFRSQEDVEDHRDDFASDSTGAEVKYFYPLYDEPTLVGFQGIPGTEILTKVKAFRKPTPAEDISATINPIIPSQYDELLYLATLYKVLYSHPRKEVQAEANEVLQLLELRKKRVKDVLFTQRFNRESSPARMRIK